MVEYFSTLTKHSQTHEATSRISKHNLQANDMDRRRLALV